MNEKIIKFKIVNLLCHVLNQVQRKDLDFNSKIHSFHMKE